MRAITTSSNAGIGHSELAKLGVARNPGGPASPFDPAEPRSAKRVHRGGSFLCTDEYCSRYMVGTHGKGKISTASKRLLLPHCAAAQYPRLWYEVAQQRSTLVQHNRVVCAERRHRRFRK